MKSPRIVFVGLVGDALSEAALEACAESAASLEVLASVKKTPGLATQEPVRLGRHPASPWAGRTSDLEAKIAALRADTLIAAGCHHLLPSEVLRGLEWGAFNVHPSVLPNYRGTNPIFWQYQRGDLQAGVTLHCMDAGADTGPIVAQESFEISLGEPLAEAVPRYALAARRLVGRLMNFLAEDEVPSRRQDHLPCPFPARRARDEDYRVDWQGWPLERIWHFLRLGQATADRALAFVPQGCREDDAGAGPSGRWKIGGIERGTAAAAPGAITARGDEGAVHHRDGRILLHRLPPA